MQFSQWRFAHQAPFVFLPVTLSGVEDKARPYELDPAYRGVAFDHLDETGMSHGGVQYCADAIRCFELGA
jgi:hypothetical protein